MTFRMNEPHAAAAEGELGVLVVGCGYWGRNYVRIFQELTGTHVAAVCDASIERLEAVAAEYPGVELVQELEAALALSAVDAVVVATPASTHYAVTRRVLESGLPVLV